MKELLVTSCFQIGQDTYVNTTLMLLTSLLLYFNINIYGPDLEAEWVAQTPQNRGHEFDSPPPGPFWVVCMYANVGIGFIPVSSNK